MRHLSALVMALAATVATAARGQQDALSPDALPEMSPAAERFKALTDPKGEQKTQSERQKKPPFEFFRTQVAPAEVIPYVKANHWVTLSLEMQANHADYTGSLRTAPVLLQGMPHQVIFRRDARLLVEQEGRLSMQLLAPWLPQERNELDLELIRPEAIRGDGVTEAILQRLLPHQMLVPILGPEAPAYMTWNRFQAVLPAATERDVASADRTRYYRLMHAQNPENVLPLSPHPLTWTAISHILWDGQNPEAIDIGQQQAMLDWLHWGGQLIIVGGAGPSLAPLQDSFLSPVLPATPSGRNVTLDGAAFAAMSRDFPSPYWPMEGETGAIPRYLSEVEPIRTAPGRSIFLSGLTPKPGASTIPLGDPAGNVVGVEWRVGRGRVLMLAVKPTDAALQNWPGLDTWVRRVIFRRPVEPPGGRSFAYLSGTEVSWLRYVGRDLGAPLDPGTPDDEATLVAGEVPTPRVPVSAWLDGAELPVASRKALERASGIRIPDSRFVLRVILAYIVALVPLNWLLCRFVLRRPEWAWAVTPVLALGFAGAVERAAAYDLGFDTACDEIDLVELQPAYGRAHVSRFAALYSTGRHSFTIAYPDEPSALALPMNMGPERYQRGEELAQSVWESSPEPSLRDFPVQPRSLAMFRAEQMDDLPGAIRLVGDGADRQLVNESGLELRDAVVVQVATGDRYRLGTLAPGATAALGTPEPRPQGPVATSSEGEPVASWIDPGPFLESLRNYDFGRPEDRGEWRLVAWSPGPHPGQELRPAVDRHRGLRLVVAHLDYGPPPSHNADVMTGLVAGPTAAPSEGAPPELNAGQAGG